MKKWRFLGVDDSFDDERCCLVGCVTCDSYVEGFMYAEIEIDGLDATEKLIGMIKKSKFREQLKCIFLPGITFGGFNMVDIVQVFEQTGIPVVVVMRRMPEMSEFISAIENLNDAKMRRYIIERAGKIHRINHIYVQLAGLSVEESRKLLKVSCLKGNMPEAVRIAHLAASAIIHGESRGKV
ncbi:endonuclease dU [Archaeoglobus neptunius]|uniref:endonuclease dU n=1 Tax=Archaeoglobus neptunius TaxID=2798580 RepID=UPI001927BDE9|nr:DUF99 family protein [Archaeoglobus neptunius]